MIEREATRLRHKVRLVRAWCGLVRLFKVRAAGSDMLIFRPKVSAKASTPIPDSVRNASSREKKRVYKIVLEKATQQQRRELEAARRITTASA